MAFFGGLGALAGLAEGYAAQQQRQQQQQTEQVRTAFAIRQLQEQARQRQQQQNIARALAGGFRSGTLTGTPDISALAALPQGTGAGGGMPGGGMPNASPGDNSMPLRQVISGPQGAIPLIDRLIRGEGGSPQGVINNPGNIKYAGLAGQTDSGVRAKDGGDFASYASPEAGRAAIGSLAQNAASGRSKAYGPAPTLDSFIKTYTGGRSSSAPPAPEGVQAPAMPPPPGGFDIATLAHQIERANPGIDDETLIGAVDAASSLMSRGTQQQWERYKATTEQTEKQREFNVREDEVKAQHEQTNEMARERLAQGENKGYQFITGPDGKIYRANPQTGDVAAAQLPEGSAKLGSQPTAQFAPADVKFWTGVIEKGGQLPPSLTRGKGGQQLQLAIMHQVAQDGFNPGQLITAQGSAQANKTSLVNMQRQADAAKSFERTARANFDQALKLAPDAIPTNLGPFFNRYVMEGEKMFGDPTVPAYVVKILTGANEYAKIMSGSTGSTGSTVDSRTEAREMFSQYLSLPQIKAVVDAAESDMDNRSGSYDEQIQLIKGRMASGGTGAQRKTSSDQGGQPPAITSKEQYDALPKGAPFLWNGQSLTKQ